MWTPIEAILRGGRLEPDAGEPLDPRRLEPERRERPDDRLLEVAAVALHVAAVPVQVEDRVADELPGPVVRGLPAAVGLDDLDLGVVGHVQLALVRAPAERDHGRVLEEDDRVRDRALRDGGRERALQVPRLDVRRRAEVQQVRARASQSKPSCVGSRLVVRLVPGLELLAQVAEEAAGEGAVDEPVVVRQREVHDRPDRDHVLAQLVLDDPRPLDDRVGAEDRRPAAG